MAESSLKDYVLKGMRPYWRGGVKHADAFTAGIADVSGFIEPAGNVFIELKALDDWPKRPQTPVKFGLDDLQKQFLVDRRGWLLCRVKRQYLLFTHSMALLLVDRPEATRDTLYNQAGMIWNNAIDWKEFAECVAKRYV